MYWLWTKGIRQSPVLGLIQGRGVKEYIARDLSKGPIGLNKSFRHILWNYRFLFTDPARTEYKVIQDITDMAVKCFVCVIK